MRPLAVLIGSCDWPEDLLWGRWYRVVLYLATFSVLMSTMYPCACSLNHVLLCDPMDCRPPGSSVHGISQARVLEWGAISFSSGSSQPRDQTQVPWGSCIGRRDSLPLSPLEKPSKCTLVDVFLGTHVVISLCHFMVGWFLVSHSFVRPKNDLCMGMRRDWQVPPLPAACHVSWKCGRVRPWGGGGTRENADGVVCK